jgi:hypothetical protein
VWICEQDPFPTSRKAHLSFSIREVDEGFLLHGDARVDILQLSRWARERENAASELAASPLGAWFWFLNEAAEWREVPAEIDAPILEEAMGVLNEFRTDVRKNALYRGRLDAERVEATLREERRQVEERLAEALAEAEKERAEKEAALAELTRLRKELEDSRK